MQHLARDAVEVAELWEVVTRAHAVAIMARDRVAPHISNLQDYVNHMFKRP
jgi:hypothetical protein